MSEQLKQELEADTDRLEAETVADSETIGEQEEKPTEGKLETQEDDELKEGTVPMGKASLADIVSGIPAPTKEEVEAAEAENAKPVMYIRPAEETREIFHCCFVCSVKKKII